MELVHVMQVTGVGYTVYELVKYFKLYTFVHFIVFKLHLNKKI